MNSYDAVGKFTIYALRDPCQCDVVRYVGLTADRHRRKSIHELGSETQTNVGLWAYSLGVFGRLPIMDVIAVVEGKRIHAAKVERDTIQRFSDHSLLNEPFHSEFMKRLELPDHVIRTYKRAVSWHRELVSDGNFSADCLAAMIDLIEGQYPPLALVAGRNSWQQARNYF